MRKRKEDGLIRVIILLPKQLRSDLEAERARSGVSVSQQARLSLSMWLKACARYPNGAADLMGNALAKAYNAGSRGSEAPESTIGPALGGYSPPAGQSLQERYKALGPEPDRKLDPAAWASWAARAGDLSVQMLAQGVTMGKPNG